PQGKLGKPTRVLTGFAKTKRLEPGESYTVTIRFPIENLASYDDAGVTGYRSAYVMEAGTYYIYVGTSVKKVEPVRYEGRAGYIVDELRIVEQLEEALAPTEQYTRLKPGARK